MGNKFIPLGVVLSVLILIFLTKPMLVEIKDLNSELKAKNEDIASINGTIKDMQQMQTRLAGASEQIKRLKLAMPAAQQLPEVLVMIEAISKKSAFKITNFAVSPTSSGNEVGVSMSGYGSYNSLYDFTDTLERNVRPIKVKTMSLTRSGSRGEIVNAAVSLGVIYQGEIKQQVQPQ